MNRKKNIFLLLIISLGSASGKESMNLWPATAPGEVAGEVGGEEKRIPKAGSNDVLRIANVCDPILTIFPVDEEKSNRTAVIVCPGGGYNILAYEHEGTQVCEWLNQLGVTAVLLKYRVPRRKNRAPHDAPLQDAQRALGIVRKNAADWSIDPNKIGILGFSAGGNLAMMALTSFSERTYDPIDEADAISCRPDFGILIYPAYLVNRSKRDKLFPEIKINDQTPPCFFAHTGDDHVPAEGSLLAYYELEKAGVEGSELHIYPYGGHGYGMKKTNKPVSQWPKRAGEWMKAMGWLELK